MTFKPTAEQVIALSRKTNLSQNRIKSAMEKLGHGDERLVIQYIEECAHAVIRMKKDENGNLVCMTNDDLAEKYKLPCHTHPPTVQKKIIEIIKKPVINNIRENQ